jgi:hypothetical protein
MNRRLDHLIPSEDVIERSQRARADSFYMLPEYVQQWIDKTEPQLPEGWRIRPWTINRCVTVRNSRNQVMQTYTYEAIEDGYEFEMPI